MDHSVTLSTQSNASNATFPIISSETHALIEEIIRTLSPDAHTFEHIFSRYKQVLEEHGIDFADEDEGYATLLKLSMQKGATWKEKWFTAQSASASAPDGAVASIDILRQRLDSLDMTIASPRHSPSPVTANDRRQPRVSLPSARNTQETPRDLRVLHNYPLTSTPRPKHAVYDIAETPSSHSFEVRQGSSPEQIELDPVLRSSYRQSSRAALGDASLSSSEERPQHPSRPRRTLQSQTAHDTAAARPLQDANIVNADRFRYASLTSLFLDRWQDKTQVIQTRNTRVQRARDVALRKRAWAAWTLRMRYIVEALEPKADAWRTASLLVRTFGNWRQVVKRRRRAEWEDAMKVAFSDFAVKRHSQLASKALKVWRQRALNSRSDGFRKQSLLRMCFTCMARSAARSKQLALRSSMFHDQQEHVVMYSALETWHHATALSIVAREVRLVHEENVLRNAFMIWNSRKQRSAAAEFLYRSKLIRAAFAVWHVRLETNDAMHQASEEFREHADGRLRSSVFGSWFRLTKAAKFKDRYQKVVKSRQMLHHWLIRCHVVAVEMPTIADTFRQESTNNIARGVLHIWSKQASAKMNRLENVEALYLTKMQGLALQKWKQMSRKRRRDERKADVARDFFLSRRSWGNWSLVAMQKRANRLRAVRDTRSLAANFKHWLQLSRQSRSKEALVVSLQGAIDFRIAQSALTHWVNRIVDLRSRILSTAHASDQKRLRKALEKWQTTMDRRLDDLSLVDSFRDVKQEELVRRFFIRWCRRARASIVGREKAEERAQQDRLALLAGAFDRWRMRQKRRHLASLEVKFDRAKSAILVEFALEKWQQRTQTLPALRFAGAKLKLRAFSQWRRSAPLHQKLVQAERQYDCRLANAAIQKWVYLSKRRASRRAADRFRRRSLPVINASPREVLRARFAALPSSSSTMSLPALAESTSEILDTTTIRSTVSASTESTKLGLLAAGKMRYAAILEKRGRV